MEKKCFLTKQQGNSATGEKTFLCIKSSVFPPPQNTTVHLGRGLLQNNLLHQIASPYSTPVLVIDEALFALYGIALSNTLDALVFKVPSGETAKSRLIKEELEDFLIKHAVKRDSLLIALGGGSTLDLSAFVASTYMRGIALMLIPTTLLAAVDAAIGGKTAINTPLGKNLLGTFYFPQTILVDLDLFATLPDLEWKNGLVEIVKLGLILKASLLDLIEKSSLEELVREAILTKLNIVEQDPFEQRGLRELLNFGHTFGHAFEAMSDYRMPHGSAVALGILAESHLSAHLGFLPLEEHHKIEILLRSLFSPQLLLPKNYTRAAFFDALKRDKKRKKQIECVLPAKIGRPVEVTPGKYCVPILEKEIESTLSMLERLYVSDLALL